jgi:hypothetical protein
VIGVKAREHDEITDPACQRSALLGYTNRVKTFSLEFSSQLPTQTFVHINLFPGESTQFTKGFEQRHLLCFLERELFHLKLGVVQIKQWHSVASLELRFEGFQIRFGGTCAFRALQVPLEPSRDFGCVCPKQVFWDDLYGRHDPTPVLEPLEHDPLTRERFAKGNLPTRGHRFDFAFVR